MGGINKQLARLALAAAVVLASSYASAQAPNAWINYSQTYYKIPVVQTGIYRLTYQDLSSAGVPLGSIDPRRINIFHRGVEQAIFVQGESDAHFDASDFLEFYGRRNDGTLDADLYRTADRQPHSYYNLYSDTTSYFLTWNPLPVQGKRMTINQEVTNVIPKETWHRAEIFNIYTQEYASGFSELGEIQDTAFDYGEGWTGQKFCVGLSGCTGQLDFNLTGITNTVNTGNPELELLLTGRDVGIHTIEIYAGPSGLTHLATTTTFFGFNTWKVNVPLSWSDVAANGTMSVSVKIVDSGVRDQISVAYLRFRYAQNFSMSGAAEKYFHLTQNGSDKSYLEITSPPSGMRLWDVTDANDVSVVVPFTVATGVGAVVPSASIERSLLASTSFRTPSIVPVKFRNINPAAHNFLIVSHRLLMKAASGYANPVQSYAAYRASAAGGRYDTLTVTMDQLYNQFNYGETSPRALFQFVRYMVQNGQPRFLFLVGKGLDVSNGFWRKTNLAPNDMRDLVPTAGSPGSDMAYSAGLNGSGVGPALATGRLTASTAAQVAAYLNKVKESEALPSSANWRKNFLHLSGGIAAGEPEEFLGYMNGFKQTAEGPYLGASIQTISKQSLNVELINVKDQVNSGIGMVTFFGHSGPGTIDIDIGYVTDPTLGYNNTGKYPAFLINGCNAGRFFDNRVAFGEDWMLATAKGARAFIAHSSFGFTSTLNVYTSLFYQVAFGDSTYLGKGIGEVQVETARRYLQTYANSLSAITQVQQMVLLGDPAIVIFPGAAPDYTVTPGALSLASLDGKPVTSQSPAFAVNVEVTNQGMALDQNIRITLTRRRSDQSTVVIDSLFQPVLNKKNYQFIIRRTGDPAEAGANVFTVKVNADQSIPETDYANNTTDLSYFIPLNGTLNLFPTAYSIVSQTSQTLTWQNSDLLAASKSYVIEVDTAATFDSPYLNRKVITAGAVAKMPVTLLPADSMVYYWRTRFEKPASGESQDWSTSSFAYLKGAGDGWTQMKFPQMQEDLLTGLRTDPVLRRFLFDETRSNVDVTTYGSANPAPYTAVTLAINGEQYNIATQGQPCRNNTLNLVAFDKTSTVTYAALPLSFQDPRTCGRTPQTINSFLSTEIETGNSDDLAAWVSAVKVSDSVVLFSIGDAGYASWSAGVKNQLTQLGIATAQLSTLQPGEPFVIFGKKGAPAGSALVSRPSTTPLNSQSVTVNKTITGLSQAGTMTSVLAGPATQWASLTLRVGEQTPNDIWHVNILGVTSSGTIDTLKRDLQSAVSLADIDAIKYPYLRLMLYASDAVDQNPVQLRRWQINYTPAAEGILVFKGATAPLVVQEGQGWSRTYGFANISTRTFQDSLTVVMTQSNQKSLKQQQRQWKIHAAAPGDTTWFKVTGSSVGWAGENDLTISVNPRVLPELYYDNNQLTSFAFLQVEADRKGPVLDVRIDGRVPANGDIIGSSPSIAVTLLDQNPYLPKTDTTGVELFFRSPCAQGNCPYVRIPFTSSLMKWTPATDHSEFTFTFTPVNLLPGIYGLKVQGMDASGNTSGATPYEVTLEVKNDVALVVRRVYPNPTSADFYFDLYMTGSDELLDCRLDIYSSQGSLIRTFGNELLGQLHPGSNTLRLPASDAQDQPLPTGLYLYRLRGSSSGRSYTSTGRLVVVR